MPSIRRSRERQKCLLLVGFGAIFMALPVYVFRPFYNLTLVDYDLLAQRNLLRNRFSFVGPHRRRWKTLQSIITSNNETTGEPVLSGNTTQRISPLVLYTVTTLSEYNSGERNTVRGSDRFNETLVPILSAGVTSMIQAGYAVDVFLICGFELRPERRRLLQQALPESVGLQVWDDAIPLNYNMNDMKHGIHKVRAKLENHSRGLARQHRFVIRDKLPYYDFFVSFEDDMLIKSEHLNNYLQMTQHLYQLRKQLPTTLADTQKSHLYFGNNSLTQSQLQRTIPGFIRVEAVLNKTQARIPPLAVQVPVDLENQTIDASPCCHVPVSMAHARLPAKPSSHDLIVWETQILPLGVRQMPALMSQANVGNPAFTLDWVLVQRGTPPPGALPDYWSGNDGYYHNDTVNWRPKSMERKYINNQGGYMATKWQLLEWHIELCQGGFLPPFDSPTYGTMDGLDLRDVEYWSGGVQLTSGVNGCNLQRIINLERTAFSRHILYHTINNKQEQLQHVRERFTRLDDLYGMLTSVRKNAQRAMPQFQANYTKEDHQSCQRDGRAVNNGSDLCLVVTA